MFIDYELKAIILQPITIILLSIVIFSSNTYGDT
jgi:hypothetical protein